MKDKNVSDQGSFDIHFWNERYLSGDTRWDLGECSPPLKNYIDQLPDKEISILIPGAGNAYEASYLNQLGFKSITLLDIAPQLIESLQLQFKNEPSVKILQGDFFDHDGRYDLILEQTFFCALHPDLRVAYTIQMHELMNDQGRLVGLLFDKDFHQPYPPFGGNENEYRSLFSPLFNIEIMAPCYNSYISRMGNELFIKLSKK